MKKQNPHTFSRVQLGIVSFCAEECVRQNTGPDAVVLMVNAYNYALQHMDGMPTINLTMIMNLAQMIEPVQNFDGYRRQQVTFKDGGTAVAWQHISDQMIKLVNVGQPNMTPEEFVKRLMEIHPFVDGNGRTGAIVYNAMLGTLHAPVAVPQMSFY